jgi:hypothetical protein
MSDSNPYEAPQHLEKPQPKDVMPHTTSIRAEAWRGAKLGLKIGLLIAIPLTILVLIVEYYELQQRRLADPNLSSLSESKYIEITLIMDTLAISLFIAFCGGVGSLVMGLLARLRTKGDH